MECQLASQLASSTDHNSSTVVIQYMKVAEVFDDLEELEHHPLLKTFSGNLYQLIAQIRDQQQQLLQQYIYYCTGMPWMHDFLLY